MRFKLCFLLLLVAGKMYGAAPDTMKLSKFPTHAVDTGTHVVGVETTSGVSVDHLYPIAGFASYILGNAISGTLYNMPVFYSSGSIGTSNWQDSTTINHGYLNDTIKIGGMLYVGVVPAATNPDSIAVIGANKHTLRMVRPPVSGPDILTFWPLDSFALTLKGTAGTYGDATHIPVITTDNKGRVTGVTVNTFTATPGGTAGGDLNGTYPNPNLNASVNNLTAAQNLIKVGAVSTGTWTATPVADAYVASATNWNLAYTNRITTFTTTGSSGAATLGSNTLNIPTPTLAGLGGIGLTSLSASGAATYNNTTGAIGFNAAFSGTLTNWVWNGGVISSAYIGMLNGGQVGIAGLSATGTASSTTFLRGDNTWGTPSSTPGGSASGDLSGSYPGPSVATGAITNAKVNNAAAIAYSKLNLAGSVANTDLVNNSVTVNGSAVALGSAITVTAVPATSYLPQMVSVSAPSSPYVPNSSNAIVTSRLDINITGLAGALTFSAPTGSWTYGQLLVITIKDAGSAETLSWNAAYIAGTTVNSGALPTTTTAGKVMMCVFKYYAASTFQFIGFANGY